MATRNIPIFLKHTPTPRAESFALLAGLEAAVRGILISVMPLTIYDAVRDAGVVSRIYFLVGIASLLWGLLDLRTSGDNTAASHFTMGRAYYKAGMISEAKRALKMALSSDHSFAKASILLAQCYLKENAKPKAIKVLQQGVKNTPQSLELKTSLLRLETHTQKVN
ncbi:MAG: tetratricopeptide repeat protein [Leptospira bouyouniensis]